MTDTAIAWTDKVWNPIAGCSRVSAGCEHCYAERFAHRLGAMGQEKYRGLTKKVGDNIRWTGVVRFVEKDLDLPLRWRKPQRIFVNSMSDLFHEKVPDEWIDRILGICERTPQHKYQILTKRPARMQAVLGQSSSWTRSPLPNCWFGVSVESRKHLDRLDLLRQTPAAVRFVSFEPLLEDLGDVDLDGIDQAIFGGESGPKARPCDLAWIRGGMARARLVGCRTFVKQLGARPIEDLPGDPLKGPMYAAMPGARLLLRDRAGADPAEWPEDLRVQEYPR